MIFILILILFSIFHAFTFLSKNNVGKNIQTIKTSNPLYLVSKPNQSLDFKTKLAKIEWALMPKPLNPIEQIRHFDSSAFFDNFYIFMRSMS